MNVQRIDSIIRYALAVAAENDERWDRELGPIHLIKYVYLGDLAHAERHSGETFTGAPWRFYNYGPWAVEVFDRVEPAATGIDAVINRISNSQYDGDLVRYRLDARDAEDQLRRLESALPVEVLSRVRRSVQEYGKDTQSLLSFVYRTRPMLRAAPGEDLDFSVVTLEPATPAEPRAEAAPLSGKAQKRRLAAIGGLRERIQQRLGERRARRRERPNPAPRYDEVFAEGQQRLDEVAGVPIEDEELEVRFSDEVWHSRGRADTEIP